MWTVLHPAVFGSDGFPSGSLVHSWLEAPEKGVSVLVSRWEGRAGGTFSSLWEPEGGGKMKLAHHFYLSNRRPNAQLFMGYNVNLWKTLTWKLN